MIRLCILLVVIVANVLLAEDESRFGYRQDFVALQSLQNEPYVAARTTLLGKTNIEPALEAYASADRSWHDRLLAQALLLRFRHPDRVQLFDTQWPAGSLDREYPVPGGNWRPSRGDELAFGNGGLAYGATVIHVFGNDGFPIVYEKIQHDRATHNANGALLPYESPVSALWFFRDANAPEIICSIIEGQATTRQRVCLLRSLEGILTPEKAQTRHIPSPEGLQHYIQHYDPDQLPQEFEIIPDLGPRNLPAYTPTEGQRETVWNLLVTVAHEGKDEWERAMALNVIFQLSTFNKRGDVPLARALQEDPSYWVKAIAVKILMTPVDHVKRGLFDVDRQGIVAAWFKDFTPQPGQRPMQLLNYYQQHVILGPLERHKLPVIANPGLCAPPEDSLFYDFPRKPR